MRMNPNLLLSCNNHADNNDKYVIFRVVVSNLREFNAGGPLQISLEKCVQITGFNNN